MASDTISIRDAQILSLERLCRDEEARKTHSRSKVTKQPGNMADGDSINGLQYYQVQTNNYHKFIYKVTQLALKMKTTNEECRDARNKIDLEYEEERNGITREMAKVKENLGEILLLHNKGIREKVGIEEECEEERRELVLERERLEEDRMELIRERERLEEELKENRMELVRERKILEEEREEERRELVRERERLEKAREEELKTLALRKARAETTKAEHETKLMLAQAMLAEAEWEIRMAQVQAVRKMNHLKDENENEEDDDGTSMPGTLTPSLSLTS